MPDYAAHQARPEADRDDLRFERLIAPYLGDGYALAQALSTDRASAQDAVQGAALKAWQRMGQLREDGKARAWFLTIVVNECRSTWRKRRAFPVDVESSHETISWPAGVDQRLDVRSAMQRLNRDDRVVLSLRFLMDLSVDETAAVLRISSSAVKARTARAAVRFRKLMQGEATR
jgi:RNA polymerase sigma-70 factor, ECF subfamily